MTIIDRYLVFLFLKTLLISFVSLLGLFVVVHAFSNLDELAAISEQIGWWGVFEEFYLPRFADLYDKTAAILVLVSALFTISMLQRRREMTAMEAAGLTKARILRSVLILSTIGIALTVVNREWIIPQFKYQLVQTPQSWGSSGEVEMRAYSDFQTGVVVRGDRLRLEEGKITEIQIQLPYHLARQLPRIKAKWGMIKPAGKWNPAGIWLHQVKNIEELQQVGSLNDEFGEPLVFTSVNHRWVGAGQCFVRCQIDPRQVAFGDQLMLYQSTPEIIEDLKKPKRATGRPKQIALHARMVKPLLDLALLLLGLPIVVGGVERNVFITAGLCFWVVAGVQLTTSACYALGASNLIQPTALAAWMPVMMFVPLASVAIRKLKR